MAPGHGRWKVHRATAYEGGQVVASLTRWFVALIVFLAATGIASSALAYSGSLDEAKALAQMNDTDKRPFWSASDPDPSTPAGRLFHMAYRLQKDGKCARAILAYRKAVERDPDLFVAHYNMGLCLEERKQWAQAEDSFKKAAELKRLEQAVWKHLAYDCFQQGKDEEGLAYITRLLSL